VANCVENPGQLRAVAAAVKRGETTATALVERYLARIEKVQPVAEPWSAVDAERALAVAAERDKQVKRDHILGPLHGIPVAVKDIIDIQGLATRCNCKAYKDRAPASSDAEVVLALKAAGAVMLGKAHTTEFAFFDPSPARNPHDTDHTPGGSSSGSAAAVAAGTAPLAVGTQTMASVNRPAAYCGVSAFKPSTRSVCGYGVSPLAPSYDTVGYFGWSVADAVYAYTALSPPGARPSSSPAERAGKRVVFIEDDLIADADPEMARAVAAQLEHVKALGYRVEKVPSPVAFNRIRTLHWNTMVFETARTLAHLKQYSDDLIGQRLRDVMAEGRLIDEEQYVSERSEINHLRTAFFAAFDPDDVFLWPAAPGPATKGIVTTGEPKYIAPWTLLGGPIVTIPIGMTSAGLPLGSILSARPGTDTTTGAIAEDIAA
jgi:aspartyl-tRNA(Asn)/glutamyl-tRNA(Gln) amidotransferase subunit A